jgi:hypothetical protein
MVVASATLNTLDCLGTGVTTVNGVIVPTRNGTVNSGRHLGATVIETVSLGTLDLTACTGDGIESADYANTLTITGW